jgi:ABC-type transporter Mla maintaining outer membrane lipid asymmetry permease subunit MlaE
LEKDKEARVIPTYRQGVAGHSLSRLFSVGLCDLADEFGPAHAHGLLGGFLSEVLSSHIAPALYLNRAFDYLQWANFIAPTLKTAVFGFIIGCVSSYFGYTTDKGAKGVGEAATNSVVVSSLLIIVADVLLIKCIFFLFPDTAI